MGDVISHALFEDPSDDQLAMGYLLAEGLLEIKQLMRLVAMRAGLKDNEIKRLMPIEELR